MGFGFSFGNGNNHGHGLHSHGHRDFDDSFSSSGHHQSHHRSFVNPSEMRLVQLGEGVFGYIEKSGMFYNGDVPGVNGINSVRMEKSFDECYRKLVENVRSSISVSFSSFRQSKSFEEIVSAHPDAEIIFIRVK